MRGGTSKALVFHRRDLPHTTTPHDCRAWDEIFLAALGSPDPHGRQLDGMGGGQSSLSKIAVVSPSEREDADVEFTFAQVGITDRTVGYKGNCGNISSAVAAFAIDEGLVAPSGDQGVVRIFNTNTSKIIQASFAVVDGRAATSGDYVLQGVAGTGAPIRLSFLDPGGAATGRLLPTGRATDDLSIAPGLKLQASLIDAGNPVVCVRASALGLSGTETPAALLENPCAMDRFEDLRIAAAVAMGLVDSPEVAATQMRNMPLVVLLGEAFGDADLQVRAVSAGLPHGAIPLTAALCLAVGARVPGTLVQQALRAGADLERIRIGHASGVIDVAARVEATGDTIIAKEAVVFRTARRLMEGRVLVPLA